MPVANPDGTDIWTVDAAAAIRALDSSERGLTSAEATRRLELYGPNEVKPPPGEHWLWLLLRQFQSPLIYMLLAAAVVALALGELIDAAAIALVLVFNAAIGFTQSLNAARELAALGRLMPERATVVRDGLEQAINTPELVPGDVVLLEAGARVPADLRLLHAVSLEADQALLTGESVPVPKSALAVGAEVLAIERPNMLIGGTNVTRGRARAVVATTGEETELGLIAASAAQAPSPETPLQRRMNGLARAIGTVLLLVLVVGFAAGLARGESPGELLLTLVALAVSAIPEGAADRAHNRPRGRGAPDGGAQRHHPRTRGGRNARELHRDRLRQDRHAHAEPHDGPVDLGGRSTLRGDRCGIRDRGCGPRRYRSGRSRGA